MGVLHGRGQLYQDVPRAVGTNWNQFGIITSAFTAKQLQAPCGRYVSFCNQQRIERAKWRWDVMHRNAARSKCIT